MISCSLSSDVLYMCGVGPYVKHPTHPVSLNILVYRPESPSLSCVAPAANLCPVLEQRLQHLLENFVVVFDRKSLRWV
jgi:hypothetical protein